MRLARRLAALFVTSGLLAGACSAPSAGPAAPSDGTFVIGLGSEFDTLSPVMGYAPDGGSLIYEGLMSRGTDLSLTPAAAAAPPTVSADGLTVSFTLRDGLRFHDGRPVTGADVEYTYEAVLDEANSSPIRGDYAAIEKVDAPDPRTVVFTLAHPYAPLAQRATLGIVPAGDPLTGDRPVGSGPYRFVSRTPGDKIVLEANRDYRTGPPALARLVLAFAEDDNVRATRMSAGEFDAAILPPKAAARFEGQPGITVHKVPSADYRGIMFPLGRPVTGDRTVRRALGLAVDRQAMVDVVLAGAGAPAFGPVSPDTTWHNPAVTGAPAGDPEAARRLLQEDGWAPGEDGVRVKDGVRAAFTLMYPAGDSLRKELALAVASDARAIGVDVRLAGLDWDAIEPRMSTDALIMGYGSPYDPDYVNYELFHSSYARRGFFNPGGYDDPEVDRLLETGRRSGDPAVRRQAYLDFQKIVHDEEVWTYLVFLKHVYVVRGSYEGVRPGVDAHEHATGGLFRDIHTWKPAA
ncbi:ABC transporter substrate-binding protein [Planomonospora sp. ID91781]|uniref:ABC transporter substrate-binding protein n=1 Tax=Planomonospora sp. ID91781 TaxID=2738135 RepID=UPI0018C4285D|nr:ABC transporter substrate-binding protein [Planomonospora sp. ID91781]MBG0822189.1 ABC transporter substrate-binding protein [Planomonospora sp. ID91781]